MKWSLGYFSVGLPLPEPIALPGGLGNLLWISESM